MTNAFLFGTFNPVTNAHIEMGMVARNVLGPQCNVTYIPSGDAYIRNWKGYKDGDILPGKVRAGLLRDAVSRYGFRVATVEVEGITDGRTYNTIDYFGFDGAVLCLGMDNIIQITKWYRWQKLLEKCRLLVFKRDGISPSLKVEKILKYALSCQFATLDEKYMGISSTKVRICYVNRDLEQVKDLVPENVYHYLEENKNVYV